VGSTLAVYNYVKALRGEDFPVQVYLEEASSKFAYLKGFGEICHTNDDGKRYELAVVCDCADEKRLGRFSGYYEQAPHSFVIDHHYTNTGYGECFVVDPEASSACEIVYGLLEEEYFNQEIAKCIYTGIVHDTGVFRYTCTSPNTMKTAAACMAKGIPFGDIIDDSFFSMSFAQKRMLGVVLNGLRQDFDGRFVFGFADQKMKDEYGLTNKELDGFIDAIRSISGVLAAAFLYQCRDGQFKLSLRSNSDAVNVADIAASFGGGGHKRAAGCFMGSDPEEDYEMIKEKVGEQLDKLKDEKEV